MQPRRGNHHHLDQSPTTSTSLQVAGGSLSAHALATKEDVSGAVTGTAPEFTVEIVPSQSEKVSVGIQESEVSSGLPMTRASVWGATLPPPACSI